MRNILIILAGFLALGWQGSALRAAPDEIVAEFDASEFERLAIHASVGSVRIKAADTELIRVRIRIEPDNKWFSSFEEELDDVRLESAELASTLRLKIDLPSDVDRDDIEEHWDVTIPAQLETQVKIGVGMIEVSGTTGDVEAHAGVGEVDIDSLSGAVRAHTSVGDVRVTSKTRSAGDIKVDTDVGNAGLKVDGTRIEADRGWGPGSQVRLDGDGEDKFDITADVGNANLVIEGS